MRRIFLLFLLCTAAARAQYYPPPVWYPYPPHHRGTPSLTPSWVTVGGYIALGGESHDTPEQSSAVFFPVAGVFADFTRHAVRPGFDLRGEGGTLGVRGTLLGPRVSANYGPLHPYGEFLLGPNHYETAPGQVASFGVSGPDSDKHGLAVKGVIGIDIDASPHLSWRVVEFSEGSFNGIPRSRPQSFSTGIVLRLP